jgi:peptidase E
MAAHAASGADDAAARARVSHLALFPMPTVPDLRAHLLAQDAIWVGGGSVANQMAVWRTHGVDGILREAYAAGVVLSGVSAGGVCWFAGATTDSFGPELLPFTGGLALIDASLCPHYDGEARRRPAYLDLVGDGSLPAGWGADDGTLLHFVDEQLVDVAGDRDGAGVVRVERAADGVTETPLSPRRLPD